MTTIFEKLLAANLPVLSADETGAISTGAMSPEQQVLFNNIVMQYFQPAVYADLQLMRTDKQSMRDQYVATLDTLTQIENAVTPTNAQIITAVKFLAKTLRLLLKLIARTI